MISGKHLPNSLQFSKCRYDQSCPAKCLSIKLLQFLTLHVSVRILEQTLSDSIKKLLKGILNVLNTTC